MRGSAPMMQSNNTSILTIKMYTILTINPDLNAGGNSKGDKKNMKPPKKFVHK